MSNGAVTRRGQWARAPLVLVLAQVRFLPNAAATPERLRDAIATRTGVHFPTITQTDGVSTGVNFDAAPGVQPAVQQTYDLISHDVDAMVRVQRGALTYAVTSYIDSSHFRHAWLDITDALMDVQITKVTRLGLRYVDFLLPRHGQRPEDYVNAPWNLDGMPNLPGAARGPDRHVSMVDVAYCPGRMRLQFMRGFGVPSLPMDLQGMLNPIQQSVQCEPGECGVIDIDRWIDTEHSVDRTTLDHAFTGLHGDVSSAFSAMISPLARREWRSEGVPEDSAVPLPFQWVPSQLQSEPALTTPAEMVETLREAFGLNVTQLAQALHVERITAYAWLHTDRMEKLNSSNRDRLWRLYRLARQWQSCAPLAGKYLVEIIPGRDTTLLQMLCARQLEPGAFAQAYDLLARATHPTARTQRHRAEQRLALKKGIDNLRKNAHKFGMDLD